MTEEEQLLAGFAQAKAKAGGEEPEEPETPEVTPPDEGPTKEELAAQLRDAQQRERSVAGRISAYDRKNNQLESELAALKQQIAALTAAKAVEKSAAEPDLLDDTPELKKAIEGRVSKVAQEANAKLDEINKRFSEVESKVGKAVETVEPLATEMSRREAEQVAATLDEKFKGWRSEVFESDGVWTPAFKGWVETQPKAIQELAVNGRSVPEAETVLKLFRADTGTKQQSATERLRQAAGIGVSSAVAPKENPDDFQAGYLEARRRAQR